MNPALRFLAKIILAAAIEGMDGVASIAAF
jgi:hypothetical protein